MIKLNKKGFTLVELLVVLVILVVIMAVAIPSVTSSLERSKQKQYDSKVELIVSAAELYIDRHKNTTPDNCAIYISDLICDGLITKEQVKDPFSEDYTINGYYSCNTGKWEVDLNDFRVEIENFSC